MKKILQTLSIVLISFSSTFSVVSCNKNIHGKVASTLTTKQIQNYFADIDNFSFSSPAFNHVPINDYSFYNEKNILNSKDVAKTNKLFAYMPASKPKFTPIQANYMIIKRKIATLINWDKSAQYTLSQEYNFVNNDPNLQVLLLDAKNNVVSTNNYALAQGKYSVKLIVSKDKNSFNETYLTPGTYQSPLFSIFDLAPKTDTNKLEFYANDFIQIGDKAVKNIAFAPSSPRGEFTWEIGVKKLANQFLYTQTQLLEHDNIYSNNDPVKFYPFNMNDLHQCIDTYNDPFFTQRYLNPDNSELDQKVNWDTDTYGYYTFKYGFFKRDNYVWYHWAKTFNFAIEIHVVDIA